MDKHGGMIGTPINKEHAPRSQCLAVVESGLRSNVHTTVRTYLPLVEVPQNDPPGAGMDQPLCRDRVM